MADVAELRLRIKAQAEQLREVRSQFKLLQKELRASQSAFQQAAAQAERFKASAQKSQAQVQALRLQMKGLNNSMRQSKAASEEFNNSLLKFGRTLASFAAVFYTLKNLLGVFRYGIEFNKVIEDSKIGLTALIAATHDYTDATGKTVTGMTAFNAAQEDAIGLQKELRVAALRTAATYEELVYALQQAFVPATGAGFQLDQLVDFAQRFAQIMQVVGIPMNQIGEEMRSFLTATGSLRTTRTLPFFEGLGLGRKEVKKLLAEGKLAEEYFKRTWAVQMMAAEASKTWTVSLSNLQDALQNVMGIGTVETFEFLKQTFLDLTNYVLQYDTATRHLSFNPAVVDAVRELDRRMANLLLRTREFIEALARLRNEYPVVARTAFEIGDLVINVAALGFAFTTITGFFRWLGRMSFVRPFEMAYNAFMRFIALWKRLPVVGRASLVVIGALLIYTFKDAIATVAQMFWNWLKEFPVYGKTIGEWAEGVKRYIILQFAKLGIDLPVLLENIGWAAGKAYKKGWDASVKVEQIRKGIVQRVKDFYRWELEGALWIIETIKKKLTEAYQTRPDVGQLQLPRISATLFGVDEFVSDVETEWVRLKDIWNALLEGLKTSWGNFTSAVEREWGDTIDSWIRGVKQFGTDMVNLIWRAWEEIKSWLPFRIPIELDFSLPDINKIMERSRKALGLMTKEEQQRKIASLKPMVGHGTELEYFTGPEPFSMTWTDLLKGHGLKRKPKSDVGLGGTGGGKGGKGGEADKESRRLLSLYDSILKQYLSLTESTYDAEVRKHKEMMDKIVEGKERQVTAAQVVEMEEKRHAEAVANMQRDYDLMVAKSSGDKFVEIEEQAKQYMEKWGNLQDRDVEKWVKDWKTRRKAMLELEGRNDLLAVTNSILKTAEDLTPSVKAQLDLQKQQLLVSQEIERNEMERKILNGDIDKTIKDEYQTLVLQRQELERQVQLRKEWMTQGPMGGIREGIYERVGKADTSSAEAAKEWVLSLEGTVTETIAAGIVGALNGSRTDFQKVGRDIAQAFVERSINMLMTELWNVIWRALANAFNATMPTAGNAITQATTTGGQVLVTSGIKTGEAIYQGCARGAAEFDRVVAQANVKGASKGMFKSRGGGGGADVEVEGLPGGDIAGARQAEGGFFKGFIDGFKNMFKTMFDMMKSMMQGLMKMLGGLLKSLGNIIMKLISSIVKGIGGMFGGGMQYGGFVTSPTLAMIGEAGPELVLPFKKGGRGNIKPLPAYLGDGGDVNVTVINETGVPVQPDVKINERDIIVRLKRELVSDINQGGDIPRALNRNYVMNPRLMSRGG